MKNRTYFRPKHLLYQLTLGVIYFLVFPIGTTQGTDNSTTTNRTPQAKLQEIHSRLHLMHGDFSMEYDEQMMSVMYLPKDAKVLEIGGNIGRVSCINASLLTNQQNLVVLESHPTYAKQLEENRDLNGLKFHIEASALSKVPLIQTGWNSIPSEVLLPGYMWIKTITFAELKNKYNIEFDTLVVDCEGALYYILRDDPDMLNNIKLILIENDFEKQEQVDYVHNLFKEKGLKVVYSKNGLKHLRGWPCYEYFFQVWKK